MADTRNMVKLQSCSSTLNHSYENEGLKQAANCVVYAFVIILDLLLRIIYTAQPRNLLKNENEAIS